MAVRFDGGTSDRYSTSTVGMPNGSDYTLCCWVNLTSDKNDWTMIIGTEDGIGGWIDLMTNGTGTDLLFTTSTSDITGPTLSTGTWYFICGVYSGSSSDHLYHATAAEADLTDVSGTVGTINWNGSFWIGRDSFTTSCLDGRIAAVKVWSAALTADEVANERFYHAPQRTTNLLAWYPFDTGPSTADFSGNARTLTEAGTVTGEDGPPISWTRGSRLIVPSVVNATATPATIALAVELPQVTVSDGTSGGVRLQSPARSGMRLA